MTVRAALVGFGYWGANLARNLAAASSVEFVGIADVSDELRSEAARRFPGVRVYRSLAEVLADPDVEAVVLATPAATHGALATEVLRSGRHVLVEKPLATDVAAARLICDTADEMGRTAMVGHTFLYSPPVLHLAELIASGELGAVKYLYSQRLSLGRIRSDCDALWNLAPHDVAMLCFLVGEIPAVVTARGFSFLQSGIDDVCFASLEFPSGVGANIHVSWIDPRKTRLMTVVGDEKMAVYDDVSADQKIWVFDSGVANRPEPSASEYADMADFQWRTRSGDIRIPRIPMVEPLLAEIEEFGRCCADGTRPRTDARHGLEVVRVLEAVTRSAAAGGVPQQVGDS